MFRYQGCISLHVTTCHRRILYYNWSRRVQICGPCLPFVYYCVWSVASSCGPLKLGKMNDNFQGLLPFCTEFYTRLVTLWRLGKLIRDKIYLTSETFYSFVKQHDGQTDWQTTGRLTNPLQIVHWRHIRILILMWRQWNSNRSLSRTNYQVWRSETMNISKLVWFYSKILLTLLFCIDRLENWI